MVTDPRSGLARLLALGSGFAMAAGLGGCAVVPQQPMTAPAAVMEAPWGPFAQQCISTRLSRRTFRWRVGETDIEQTYETCAGFVALERDGKAQITASVQATGAKIAPVILRISRDASGSARAASPGDDLLLAQGSDDAESARVFARDIGLAAPQVIHPGDTLTLPLHLTLPFPLDIPIACHPTGEQMDHQRTTLAMDCSFDGTVDAQNLKGHLQLTGTEEIDQQSGVRLEGLMNGHFSGAVRPNGTASWEAAENDLLYRRSTSFD